MTNREYYYGHSRDTILRAFNTARLPGERIINWMYSGFNTFNAITVYLADTTVADAVRLSRIQGALSGIRLAPLDRKTWLGFYTHSSGAAHAYDTLCVKENRDPGDTIMALEWLLSEPPPPTTITGIKIMSSNGKELLVHGGALDQVVSGMEFAGLITHDDRAKLYAPNEVL